MQIAKLEGAGVIVAGIEKDQSRLECARTLGADVVVNTSKESLLDIVRRCTNGLGADLVYECAGVAVSLELCWEAVRKEGTVVQVGVYPGPIQTDLNKVMMKELKLVGTYGYIWTSWRRAVQLLSNGKVNTESMVSNEYPLTQFEEAFRKTQDGSAIKVVLCPQRSAP